jgi:hypothetical protein
MRERGREREGERARKTASLSDVCMYHTFRNKRERERERERA